MQLTPDTLFHDRYRLIEMKGRGSFGEVWLARDEELEMEVAVKIYIALDDRGVAEFKSEYKTTFGLNHPNLLHANHFDLFEKRPYLVMPYCPSSATTYIGTIDEPTLWRFVRDVSSGLEYLHAMGIVHHDVKPDNILVDTEGNFLITDFGISKKMRSTLRRNSMRQVEEQLVGGSYSYMGPEMFSKQPESVKASDIWALGATLYELCEGELPFFGQGGGMQLNGAAIPELHGNYSEDFKHVVQLCLAKDPWDRPLASQLREYAQGKINGLPSVDLDSIIPATNQAKNGNVGKSGDAKEISDNTTKEIKDDSPKKKSKIGGWIVGLVVVAVIAAVSIFLLPPSESPEQKLARENLGLYEQKVNACQANIDAGAFENGKYVKLLSAQEELDEIKKLEEAGRQYYPDAYNHYAAMKSQLENKMQSIGQRYADHALGFIELDPDMAVEEFTIAKKLYPAYTSLEYENFMKSLKPKLTSN